MTNRIQLLLSLKNFQISNVLSILLCLFCFKKMQPCSIIFVVKIPIYLASDLALHKINSYWCVWKNVEDPLQSRYLIHIRHSVMRHTYRIRFNTIRTFYFPKWLFGAHSIQILCKFAHCIRENGPKTGLLTKKCAFYWNFSKVRSQFKPSSVLKRIRYVGRYSLPICIIIIWVWNYKQCASIFWIWWKL